ncbi:hypothetical protein HDU82_008893 [Entophlyctis luteolus]|nr:hypothetical protein HDU82_008893 [Entophlyctis luteolus]
MVHLSIPKPIAAGIRYVQNASSTPFGLKRSGGEAADGDEAVEQLPTTRALQENHPSWDAKTQLAINTIRSINSLTEDNQVNLQRIRRVRSYVTLPTNMNVRIEKVLVYRRTDIVLEHMDALQATGTFKAEWIDYLAHSEVSMPFVGTVNLNNLNPLSGHLTPVESVRESIVLYLHGGGYCLCSRKTHRGITWKIAKFGKARVFAIDYRLSPEHVFPLALHDAISAIAYLQRISAEDTKIFIAGDSAGAGLALATTLWLRDHGAEYGLRMPAGVALMSPWIDLCHSLPSFTSNQKFDLLRVKVLDDSILNENRSHFYITNNSFLKNPYVSPLFASENEEFPLPPTLIQVGDSERLRDESIAFASNFSKSPIRLEIYEGMVHVFQMLSKFIKVADKALERLGDFIQEVDADASNAKARAVIWVANDIRAHFPAREMKDDEVQALSANGIPESSIAEDVAASIYSHENNEDESDAEALR